MNQPQADIATTVALFVRAPIPGRVKTRLAAGMGNEYGAYLREVATYGREAR